ncbi:MAG: aminopeptidase P family protein [Bacteroidetes bacterium SW_9_63_38]|nr:MAG: aminopeptidase P family protein [Bacteroidetes bacterium SW_9_63_38]
MAHRLSRVRGRLAALDTDAILLSSLPNIRWACGFTGSNGLLLVSAEEAFFVTDGRYTEQAQQEVDGAEVHIASDGLVSHLQQEDLLESFHRIVIQADDVTVAHHQQLKDRCSRIDWVPTSDVLTHAVGKKEDIEIRRIRRAQSLTEAVFEDVIETIEPGQTEREVAAEITYQHLRRGAEKMAFDPIVASGANGARPHARPTDRTLRAGDLVVIDMGAVLDGYVSDMTRTIAVGEPDDDAREGYQLVRTAQEAALNAARAGLTGKELDAAARDVIENAGMGNYFSHGLGHGIGLQVHEWPRVSHTVDDELPSGACVTIEPGIYVPEKGFGVRIEDIVVLQPEGCMNLTRTDKSLLTPDA